MIKQKLGKQLLFFDGAMGTQLQQAGLKAGEVPELWNITRTETVRDIHRKYLHAGCDIITANTFGANAYKLDGTGYAAGQVIAQAVANARAAIAAFCADTPRYVALDIGPTGKLLKPVGDLAFDDAYALFRDMVTAGAAAGADLILIETMSDAYELKAAVLAAKENCELPVVASVTLDQNGRLLTGGGVETTIALLEGLRVDAIGFNCGVGPQQLWPHAAKALAISGLPILVMPNAGMPCHVDGETHYDVEPEDFAEWMGKMAQAGVWLIGGCCGTTPAHMRAAIERCKGVTPQETNKTPYIAASSYSRAVTFGQAPVVIGERINPTGKKRLKQALLDADYDYVLQEAVAQHEQGADALDVNAGLPELDEAAVLPALVEHIQSVTDLPLQIDSADTAAMARAMRVYNGIPIVNSVNGKQSSMHAVFPLVQKYGGVVVALTLDEDGIPDTADGRIAIAKRILECAEGYGIGKHAFLFDPLTMAVSAGEHHARVTLECVRRLKAELGVKTSLGVSNVSFGLPGRDALNAAFLALTLQAGLDAAILNPHARAMRDAIRQYRAGEPLRDSLAADALLGKDPQFARYIAAYSGQQQEPPVPQAGGQTELSLGEAVLKGLKQQAAAGARRALEHNEPLDVIERQLIPALNTAGERFEAGALFLPQLLMSAEAAKAAFAVIRAHMGSAADETAGTVVIATVEGDVHDIGKNIVRALLENYQFRVIDLGKDVPAQAVVDAAIKHDAKLVGLSALMTTTVANMENTITALKSAKPGCRVMCGGAVLTEPYAKQIGADCYAKDAMASVRYAQSIYPKI